MCIILVIHLEVFNTENRYKKFLWQILSIVKELSMSTMGCNFHEMELLFGVPQGSILGLLPFLWLFVSSSVCYVHQNIWSQSVGFDNMQNSTESECFLSVFLVSF